MRESCVSLMWKRHRKETIVGSILGEAALYGFACLIAYMAQVKSHSVAVMGAIVLGPLNAVILLAVALYGGCNQNIAVQEKSPLPNPPA